MLLSPGDFSKAFDEIKTTSLTHSTCKMVVFVSSLNIDSICASKILSSLLKKNLIVFQLLPVVGYNDLKLKYEKLDPSISIIVLIGCGSMVDLESFLEIDVNNHIGQEEITQDSSLTEYSLKLTRKIYVIDGHRPWNLDNLFGSQIITCFDDGQGTAELQKEKDAYELLVAVDSEEEEDDDDESEEEPEQLADTDDDDDDDDDNGLEGSLNESRKRKSDGTDSKRQRKRVISENEKTIEEYYNQGTSIASSAALQVYTLLSSIGETNVDSLWLSIIGTTSLACSHNDVYDSLFPLLKEEVNRMQSVQDEGNGTEENSELGSTRGNKADDNRLHLDKDYGLFLLRHWNLYNSFFYSNYVNSKLQLYTNDGKKKLKTMFARMGISLASANQNWHYLDIDLRKRLQSVFRKYLSQFGLNDVIRDGFTRNFGFHGSISSSDFVEAVTALLEYDDPSVDSYLNGRSNTPDGSEENENEKDIGKLIQKREGQFITNYWKAFDSLSNVGLIIKGIDIAKLQQQFIFEKGFEIFQKRMIKNLRVFRLVVLKDFGTSILDNSNTFKTASQSEKTTVEIKTFGKNSKLFQNPLILTKLGNWILDSCSELDKELLPLVIASLDPDTDTYLVCGLPPKYPNMKGFDDPEYNAQERVTILNTFSLAFQQIANETGAKARIDSFESSMIELRKDDLTMFLERLSLSGLV